MGSRGRRAQPKLKLLCPKVEGVEETLAMSNKARRFIHRLDLGGLFVRSERLHYERWLQCNGGRLWLMS